MCYHSCQTGAVTLPGIHWQIVTLSAQSAAVEQEVLSLSRSLPLLMLHYVTRRDCYPRRRMAGVLVVALK